MLLSNYDWDRWVPQMRATLLLTVSGDEVLLIRKKRGLGAGKINGPGGKIEPGETAEACAVREVHEELGIHARSVRPMGEIRFQFTDGLTIVVYVFRADGFSGDPTETDEAIPLWFHRDDVPFAEMWPDDEIWLPWLMDGARFAGRVLLGPDDALLDHDLKQLPQNHQWPWQ